MNLTVSASPHIRGKDTTARLMLDVVIALLPALAAGMLFQGPRAGLVAAVCVLSALAGEWLLRLVLRRHNTLPDGSALVTGLLLALTLPASAPYYVAAAGGLFAVVVVKGLCGGLGQNTFNPALGARAFLMLLFPACLTRFPALGSALFLGELNPADVVTGATPLHHMQMPALPDVSLLDLFLGRAGGCIGEVSALALLLGGGWLVFRRVITLRIPAAYLGTVAVLTLVFSKGDSPILWMAYSLLSGGVLLGALFMATDYATSPVGPLAQIVYGIGCGALTVVFRYTGLFPEGVTYAILLMNAAAWLLDQYLVPRRFGAGKEGAQ
ncbi:MAG: RnfABCDGE type electron transport complex subunit D [Oscillospiraceae bacterium]|jgi:electron transport complex protein RnfD|nr:RnfABCDGE type electron transport complex subunit D [Oscillospiraceae bacterium]